MAEAAEAIRGSFRSRNTVPSDWYNRLNDVGDIRTAWLLIHYQVQIQGFRNEFLVLKDWEMDPFFSLWGTFIEEYRTPLTVLWHSDASPWLFPLGHVARYVAHTSPSFQTRAKVTWQLQGYDYFSTIMTDSHGGVTKEVKMSAGGIEVVSCPVFVPNGEFSWNAERLAQMRRTPGRAPKSVLVIHDVALARQLSLTISIGQETKNYFFRDKLIGYRLYKYDGVGKASFPTCILAGHNYDCFILSPLEVNWPLLAEEVQERNESQQQQQGTPHQTFWKLKNQGANNTQEGTTGTQPLEEDIPMITIEGTTSPELTPPSTPPQLRPTPHSLTLPLRRTPQSPTPLPPPPIPISPIISRNPFRNYTLAGLGRSFSNPLAGTQRRPGRPAHFSLKRFH